MKQMITRCLSLLVLVLFSSALFAQNWTFKKALMLDVGAKMYDTDLGITGGLDVGLGGMIYNIHQETSGLVFTGRVSFNSFSKKDQWHSIKREFLGLSGGFGLHVKQIIFGTVKVGYLKLLNTKSPETELEATSLFFAGAELSAQIANFKESGIALFLTGESGLTFDDVDLIDRKGDTFNGTGYVGLRLGIVKKIGVKNKLVEKK